MSTKTNIILVDPANPDHKAVQAAARIIDQGGIVVFPAQSLYGLAVDAANPGALKRIFDLKQRPVTNPLLVLINEPEALNSLVTSVPDSAKCLMESFWPGNITLVFHALKTLSQILTAGSGKIGVRLPGQPVAFALAREVGRPITGTSANLSGEPGCSRISDLPPSIIQGVDLILDAGILKGGTGSSVVDTTTDPVKVLREGIIPANDILAAINNRPHQ